MKSSALKVSILTHSLLLSSTALAFGGFNYPSPPSTSDPYTHQVPEHYSTFAPLTDADFHSHSPEKVELGRNLFFDKLLSGNENISCATCHHTLTNTADGLSLSVGEGAKGLGVNRDTGEFNLATGNDDSIHQRVPHNAPALFNLGAKEFTVLFNDGRIFTDPSHPSGFTSPGGNQLPAGLDNVLAAQTMFPVTNVTEMAGQLGENPIANAADAGILAGPTGVWEMLAQRLRDNDEYVDMFMAAYPDEISSKYDITFVHAGNAMGAFIGTAWRADNSPFDRYLRGDTEAMSTSARIGMDLFYRGRPLGGHVQACASCHSGRLQTDHAFHSIGLPQIGPGKDDGFLGLEDFGHERVSGDVNDRYNFRTPSLRNIVLTAPYGHVGSYDTLRAVIEHHIDTLSALNSYDRNQVTMPSRPDLDAIDFKVMDEPHLVDALAASSETKYLNYTAQDIDRIIDFLHALTDPASLDLRKITPKKLPSGLPLAD